MVWLDGLRNPMAWLTLALVAACVVLWPRVARDPLELAAVGAGRTVITFWDRHSGHEHAARKALIAEFNASQDRVYVRTVAIGYNNTMEKILTATAGASPPDVCSLDSTLVAQLAPQGVFLPLDDFMAGDPWLSPEAFYPHVWEMTRVDGHVWGVPTTTDTYCLIWNKAAFRRAGLDPERPPRTVEELEAYAARLTVVAANGTIEQMGFLPWLPWDLTHMWGGMFGGEWYDAASDRVRVAEDPALLASLRWQQSFTVDPDAAVQRPYAMAPERVAAFSRGIGDYFSANNPFYSGKVAMITEGEWQVTFIQKYAPGLEWGVAPIPQPAGVAPRGYGPSVILDCIPATSRHPEAAKEFLAWFARPRPGGVSPASDFCHAIHNIPTRPAESAQERFSGHPKFRVYIEQLSRGEIITLPSLPVAQFMQDQLERQRERVVFRATSPEQAAREIDASVNRELARVRALQARFRAGTAAEVGP